MLMRYISSDVTCSQKSHVRNPLCIVSFAVVSGSGVGSGRGGEDLVGPEEFVGQETTGPAHQQQSQAAGALLLYPFVPV